MVSVPVDVTCCAAVRTTSAPCTCCPRSRAERFAGFHAVPAPNSRTPTGSCSRPPAAGRRARQARLDLRTDLVFGLIEGVILVHRSDPERPVSVFAEAAADAALRIAGQSERPPERVRFTRHGECFS